ncbi:MAG: hypothetical protein ACQEUG_16005 [Pseudomonadota bacterium]
MAITDNGMLEYESGQSYNDWEEMTDTGDRSTFEASFAPWSGRAGFETSVVPWGLATGGQVQAGSGNDSVDVSALTAYMPGVTGADSDGLLSVSAASVSVTRASADTHIINSITVDSAGELTAVEGSEGTSFSEERGSAGGPPLIPVDSIEIAQVRLVTAAAAPVSDTEIFQVPGTHQERYDFPVWSEDPATGEVHFATALPAVHTGDLPKKVSVKGYTPIFVELPNCSDWVPADESHSVNSTQTYSGALGSVSRSLGQASFTHRAKDGITDPIVKLKNQRLWFRWFQDKNRQPFSLTQGMLGIARQYPAGDHVTVNATISAEQATVDFDG